LLVFGAGAFANFLSNTIGGDGFKFRSVVNNYYPFTGDASFHPTTPVIAGVLHAIIPRAPLLPALRGRF
jgi:hypothetical protein